MRVGSGVGFLLLCAASAGLARPQALLASTQRTPQASGLDRLQLASRQHRRGRRATSASEESRARAERELPDGDDDLGLVDGPESLPQTYELINLTRGFRFAPCLRCMAQSPTDPKVMYVGTHWGYIYVTTDGGITWEEARIRTDRWQYYGALRPTDEPVVGPAEETRWDMGHEIGDKVAPSAAFDFLEELPGSDLPELRHDGASKIRGSIDSMLLGPPQRYDAVGGAGAASRLGVGLRAGSPWLTLALRKKRGWAMGINMKQTLALHAYPPTQVTWIDVNPNDPGDAFAASGDGLLRTTDTGNSWPDVLSGATKYERIVNRVYRNPHRENEVYVTTASGLFISTDSGNSFMRVTDSMLAQMTCMSMAFHPTDPNIIYVGTFDGLFRSTDGGANFDWIFVSPWPPQNVIMFVAVDRHNPQQVLMATDDGLFRSEDGGDSFERSGGFLFTGLWMRGLQAGENPGQFYVATYRDMWQTPDGGKTWHVVYFGDIEWHIEYIYVFPSDPRSIYIVTCAEVLKYTPRRQRDIPKNVYNDFLALVRAEPTAGETVQRALELNGVDYPTQNAYRARARLSGLAPSVHAGFIYTDLDANASRTHRLLAGPTPDDSLPPPIFVNTELAQHYFAGVSASWELDKLIFHSGQVPTDRYFYDARIAWWEIRMIVLDSYLERRRLQLEQLVDEKAGLRTRYMRASRIEELTALLNSLAGDLFEQVPAMPILLDETVRSEVLP